MGKLNVEKFEGGTFIFRSRYDEAIDWSRTRCTMEQLGADYGGNVDKLVFIEGMKPIGFHCRWPTRRDFAVARKLAGIDIEAITNEQGKRETKFVANDERDELGEDFITVELAAEVARVCVETVLHWDDWPAASGTSEVGVTHVKAPGGSLVVKEGVIPPVVLEDIGVYLIAGSRLSEAEKKPIASPPSGPSSANGGATEITAQTASSLPTPPVVGVVPQQ